MIEYMVGAVFGAPFPLLLIVERRRHYREARQLPRELYGHRADPSGPTDDQHGRPARPFGDR